MRKNFYPHNLELQITQIYRAALWKRFTFSELQPSPQSEQIDLSYPYKPLSQKERGDIEKALRLAFSQLAAYSRKLIFQSIQKLPKEKQKSMVERFTVVETGRDLSLQLRMDSISTVDPPIAINDIFRTGLNDDIIESFTKTNVELIGEAYKEHYAKIQELVIKGAKEGISSKLIAKEISDLTGVSKSKAEFWAQDQSSKFFGEVQRFNQTSAGYDGFIWRSVRDSRVRLTHQDLEGKFFLWSKGSGEAGREFPGRDYRCRCFAEPAFKDEWNPSVEVKYKEAARVQRETITETTGWQGYGEKPQLDLKNTLNQDAKIIAFRELMKNNPSLLKDLNLDTEDAEIIHAWTTPDYYKDINAVLREMKEATQFELDFIERLNKALDKLDDFKGTVYRELDSKFPIKELLDNFKNKEPYTFKGFSASDKSPDLSLAKWKKKIPKYRMIIESKTGKSVKPIAWENPELEQKLDEVLFKDGAQFKILNIDKSVKPVIIHLEEI